MRPDAAVAALTLALAAGCGGGDDERGYPAKSVEAFVATCSKQNGVSEEACRCVIERLQETMSYDEFVAADEAARENREPTAASSAKLEAAADSCR
jgi:hypothetical protein